MQTDMQTARTANRIERETRTRKMNIAAVRKYAAQNYEPAWDDVIEMTDVELGEIIGFCESPKSALARVRRYVAKSAA